MHRLKILDMRSVISMRGVSKRFGDKVVLDGVDWEVASGENWALLGLNGSGKTTLLRIASGHLWPTSGEVSILGHRLGSLDLRELRRSIGWVTSALTVRMPPGLSALETVLSGRFDSMGLYDRTTAADERRARRLMGFMGCWGLRGRAFGVLSQGEAQRVLIARALMPGPRLLILDEPCVGLDMRSREVFLDSVERLASSGPTVVYVTHHIEEITPGFTHALLLKGGKVFGSGLAGEVLTSDSLSCAFSVALSVEVRGGRYYVRL
jgi:iron complex transport system ATP-binding protein